MGCCVKVLAVLAVGAAALIGYLCPELYKDLEPPQLPEEYFGRGVLPEDPSKFPKDNPEIKKFEIKVDDAVLKDLKDRLNNTRFFEPLDNVEFQYGFHSEKLKEVVDYWLTKYDWRKQEKELNKFNHFVTQIEGIDVHFIRHKPDLKGKKVRVLPLLLVHGWPGSIVEFTKILPLLTTSRAGRDYVFEVICPSIPGFGYSEAPHQPGFAFTSAARILNKLMSRLGFNKYYIQSGSWGSGVTSAIAKVYPDRVSGIHFNTMIEHFGVIGWTKYALGYFFPSYFMTQEEYDRIYPFSWLGKYVMEEVGYVFIQSSKPDTIGAALKDSPAGLAAYLLEKFSTWTDRTNTDLKDGGLTKKFTMDELLTNVMVHWTSGNVAASLRLFKAVFSDRERAFNLEKAPLKVPVGLASFPNDFMRIIKFMVEHRLRNLVRFERMPRGGHFAAMEEPQLLADEIWDFVIDVERSTAK